MMSSIALLCPPFIRLGAHYVAPHRLAVSWLSITAQARMAKVSQGTVVPNDLHTWPTDGNESLLLYSGVSCCCPVPYHLDWYAFCYRLDIPAMIASSDVCCADIFASVSTVLFGFPPAASLVLCMSRAALAHVNATRYPLRSTQS